MIDFPAISSVAGTNEYEVTFSINAGASTMQATIDVRIYDCANAGISLTTSDPLNLTTGDDLSATQIAIFATSNGAGFCEQFADDFSV